MTSKRKIITNNSKYLSLVRMMDDVLNCKTSDLDNDTLKLLIDKLLLIIKLSKELLGSLLNNCQEHNDLGKDGNEEGDCDDFKH